jgi:hypothetical protein
MKKTLALIIGVFLLFSMTISVSTFKIEPAKGSPPSSSPRAFDHFDGNAVDPSKWTVEQGINDAFGSVTVANSSVTLSSDGSGFPRVVSAVNPFPASGDFAVEFDITYTQITDYGTGVWISQGTFVPYQSNVNANIMQVWASTADGVTINFLTHDVYQNALYTHPTPFGYWNTSALIIRLQYVKGVYTIFLNGNQVAQGDSTLRPDVFGMGMPPLPDANSHFWASWTSFKIDEIKILPPSAITTSIEPSSLGGLEVYVNGTLSDQQGNPISDTNLLLYYNIPGLPGWNQLTSTQTDRAGEFSATWFPSATGNFTLKVEWQGDADHAGTFVTENVSMTQGTGQALFVVESNSTLSALSFNSTSKEIQFTASGPSGTTGYVRFVFSKTLMQNLTDFQVYLDGQQVQFTATLEGDTQVLYFQYHHSSHNIAIKLLSSESQVPEFPPAATLLVFLSFATVFAAAFLRKRSNPFAIPTKRLFQNRTLFLIGEGIDEFVDDFGADFHS